jgi:hypothetical protein
LDSSRATAHPTAPAPMTTTSVLSIKNTFRFNNGEILPDYAGLFLGL